MKKLLSSLFLLCLVATSMAQTKIASPADKDFTLLPNGCRFKSIRKANDPYKIAEGDIIKMGINYYLHYPGKEDSLFFTSTRNKDKSVTVGLAKPTYKGDLMEGLFQVSAGDSAQFLVPADSFFLRSAGMQRLPEGVKSGDVLLFCIQVKEVTPKAVFEENIRKENAKKEAEMSAKSFEEKGKREAYLKENNIKQEPTASGLVVVMQQEGSGAKPTPGQKVTVHYTGYLTDGTKFDSSVDRGTPFSFTLGKGQVIQGWDEGIAMLSPGAKAKLIIPSSIGYGGRAMATIPAFSTLIFDVELIKVE